MVSRMYSRMGVELGTEYTVESESTEWDRELNGNGMSSILIELRNVKISCRMEISSILLLTTRDLAFEANPDVLYNLLFLVAGAGRATIITRVDDTGHPLSLQLLFKQFETVPELKFNNAVQNCYTYFIFICLSAFVRFWRI